MEENLATELAKANLDCLARSFGFAECNVYDARKAADGMWRVRGEIYKGEYSVCIRDLNGRWSILIEDLSVKK